MAYTSGQDQNSLWRTTRQILLGVIVLICLALFILWRIDSPRVERLQMAVADAVLPSLEWTTRPAAKVTSMVQDFQSYVRVYEQNEELRRELQAMNGWHEAALQLEQRNARLRALNNVQLSPQATFITGEIMAEGAGPFSRSGLLNVGSENGVMDGSAALDGLGLVGRISGVGEETSRVIFLTDINSRVPVILQPSGQRAILIGDNTDAPLIDFVEDTERVQAGDRVVTSGDGRVLPADVLAGQVIVSANGRLRLRLAADYQQLRFVRVLNYRPRPAIDQPGGLITDEQFFFGEEPE
ncbi:rod shape-determining protein MreC [Monaibacterium marinum]|uniref:Cell shape-determining protein MreC n=1 Tax=Pontivivens marinum TaxID=1690039 RepID=A0A2C9CPA8_9RHOB|nr:rod shape-determining protein MreC [Monaibacterium marinum]SOH93040.1 rod shape-determining protein MreC [Monaibacterium marinum]